jgi:hypothetical protein
MRLSMLQMPRCSAAGLTAPSIGPLGLSSCHTQGWPDESERGRRGAIISGNSYRSCIGIARAHRDFAISHLLVSRQSRQR